MIDPYLDLRYMHITSYSKIPRNLVISQKILKILKLKTERRKYQQIICNYSTLLLLLFNLVTLLRHIQTNYSTYQLVKTQNIKTKDSIENYEKTNI